MSSAAPATIYDVAKVAGVAPSTVSRAFARPGRVNAETGDRIRAVAEQLGYRANPIAANPAATSTRMIAVLVSDVANPFFAEVITGAQVAAGAQGYVVLMADAHESGTRERAVLERLLPAVDGIVIASSRMSDSSIRTIAKQVPLVLLNRELTDVPSVVTDYRAGMAATVAHLRELGHGCITYVAGPEASWADGARWRALHDVACGMGLQARRMGPVTPNVEGGLRVGAELLDAHVTAVVAYNDLVAIGVVAAARRAGLAVPQDLSVVGFDDILASRLVTPQLTTVAAPRQSLGSAAVRSLLVIVGGAQPSAGRAVMLPVRLVVRGSTTRRRRRHVGAPPVGTPCGSPTSRGHPVATAHQHP